MANTEKQIEDRHDRVSEADRTRIEEALDLLYGLAYHIAADARDDENQAKRDYYRKIHDTVGDLKLDLVQQDGGVQADFDQWSEDSVTGYAFD